MNTWIRIIFTSLCYITFCYASVETNTSVPWLGVLFTNADDVLEGEVSLVIMVQARIALAPAIGLGTYNPKTLKKYSKVQFENNRTPWDVRVMNITIHPEYYKGHVDTIALVYLELPNSRIIWKPVNLINNKKQYITASHLFNIRYKDSLVNGQLVLQQVKKRMTPVQKLICNQFYNETKMYKCQWPSDCFCFRATGKYETCFVDPGMALANYSNNEWVLIGLSMPGPGCSSPGHYIEILPYVKWINNITKITKPTRRTQYKVKDYNYLYKPSWKEPLDAIEASYSDVYTTNYLTSYYHPSYRYNYCEGYPQYFVLYQDIAVYKTDVPLAAGAYRLDYFSSSTKKPYCVRVVANVVDWTEPYFYYDSKGTIQRDQLPIYGKIVPSRVRDFGNKSAVLVTDTRSGYGYNYYIYFKFHFTETAKINVTFKGERA